MEKTDFVYILRSDARFNKNDEIKYSIRSVEKYCKCRSIFIVGGLPRWAGKRIFHIPAEDNKGNKLLNAISKIKLACENKNISDNFVLMNDDFLFLKPTDEIKLYNKGNLIEAGKKHKTQGGYYFKAINRTASILENEEKGVIDYEVHYPIIFNKKKFLLMEQKYGCQIPYLFRSLYYNQDSVKSIKTKDFKAYTLNDFRKLRDGEFMSTDDPIAQLQLTKEWCDRMFPEKSKYEKQMKKVFLTTREIEYKNIKYGAGQTIDLPIPETQSKELGLEKVLQEI